MSPSTPTTRKPHPSKVLGNEIKMSRENHTQLTQDELAVAMGVTQQTVSRWEAGIIPVPIKHLEDLCKLVEADVDKILHLAMEAHAAGPTVPSSRGRIIVLEERLVGERGQRNVKR